MDDLYIFKEELKNLVDTLEKNDDILKLGIEGISKKLNNVISYEEIENQLKKSGFRGIYVINENLFKKIYIEGNKTDDEVVGFYNNETKAIIIKNNRCSLDVIEHELAHALIDGKLNKKIKEYDNEEVYYGKGLEEGIVTIISHMNKEEDLYKIKTNSYPVQTQIVKQINALYETCSDRKYNSIFEKAVAEPENIIPTIPKIYKQVLKNAFKEIKNESFIDELAYRISIDEISFLDCFTDDSNVTKNIKHIFSNLEVANRLLLMMSNPKKEIKDNYDNIFINKNIGDDLASKFKCNKLIYLLANEPYNYKIDAISILKNITENNIVIFDNISDENFQKKKNNA